MIAAADVLAVIEFGATARGDATEHSDRDLFVLTEDSESAAMDRAREQIAAQFDVDLPSVACFSVSTMDRMVGFGSLFLWHLRLEGRILSDEDGIAIAALSALRPYASFRRDLTRFSEILVDVQDELRECGRLNAFEGHVLFGIARNTCMLLTVYAGEPRFGRRSVLPGARSLFPNLPISESVFAILELGHLAYHRGASVEWSDLSGNEAQRAVDEVRGLLAFTEGRMTP